MSAAADAKALARHRADPRCLPFAVPTAEEMAASREYYARLNALPLTAAQRVAVDVAQEVAGVAQREIDARADAEHAEHEMLHNRAWMSRAPFEKTHR